MVPEEWTRLHMAMVPKPGKPLHLVKSWRPIVLMNTVGKPNQKVMADRLQVHNGLFHNLQYGSSKHRLAIDSMMITVGKVERARAEGKRATLLGKDVVSAFNRVRADRLCGILERAGLHWEAEYCRNFLGPRTFTISWDGSFMGTAHMDEGSPEGSPLSPVLWLIYIAETLRNAQGRMNILSLQPAPSTNGGERRVTRPKPHSRGVSWQVDLFSYADDVNPLVKLSKGA